MPKDDCFFCGPLELPIQEFEHFTVYLFKNQYYLGRLFIRSNRHIEDITDLTKEEIIELVDVLRKMRVAIKKLFDPDMFNYASLGNEIKHFHLHVFPRYSRKVTYDNTEFRDENWGKPPYPYNKGFQIEKATLEKIRSSIIRVLKEL